jgi:16S rRNA A1518/A1519 N6-dimethyltransferase RsmA/KsgA/DIM1 with predicted DNA glycosylase/AP lyase activity
MRLKIPDCEMILKNADIDPARRAQTLEPVEWVNLTDEFIRQNSKKDA